MGRRRTLLLFAAAVALQVAILVGVPARKAFVRWTGKTIYLPVQPVDPYSLMSGYYALLRYDMTNPWKGRDAAIPESRTGSRVYAILEAGPDHLWRPVGYSWDGPPATLPAGSILLKGHHEGWQHLEFGIEEFFIPEARREELDRALREADKPAYAEVRVSPAGEAALVHIHAGGRTF